MASGIFALVFIGVLVFTSSRGSEVEQSREVARRLTRPADEIEISVMRKQRPQEGALLGALYKMNLLRKLEEAMWQAGMYMRVGDILLIIVLAFGAGLFGGNIFFHDIWFALVTGAVIGIMPLLYIQFMKKRRLKAFANQLPFALDLIKSSLEAGHSLQRALQVLVSEFADPLGSEFRTVLEQNRIGLPLPRALEDMLKRVPEDDLRLLVVAVRVQTEVGSSLAQIVGRLSEIVRIRQRLRMQIRALTAQSRLGGMVVGCLPIVVLILFSLVQPGYTDQLFHDPTGQKILKFAVGSDLLALITIRRLLRVNY
ncbi:MAG: type II secretion system F family protein [Candidatus Binatus sp.]|uniref:type II secretion system F family protein n=1 Tax=Candidatus Binatus sp. TaxID=2811406 RepID=UPI003BAFF2EA